MTSDLSPSDFTAPKMSVREKVAWISLVTTLAVYVPYFLYVCRVFVAEAFHGIVIYGAFIGAVIVQSLLMILAYFLFAFRQRNEPRDERDAAVEARAFRYGYGTLIVSCFLLMLAVCIFLVLPTAAALPGGRAFAALLIAQAILLCCVLAEVTRYAVLALGYRRMA